MRNKERIPIILKNIEWETFLIDMFGKDYDRDILTHLKSVLPQLKEYWSEYYDMRIGQALINMGVIPDSLKAWHVEGTEWMIDNKLVKSRDILFWGVNYTKEMEQLPKTDWRLIKDLDTEHIQAILDGGYVRYNDYYKENFENELKFRNDTKR